MYLSSPHTWYRSFPSQFSWIDHPNDTWWGVKNVKVLTMFNLDVTLSQYFCPVTCLQQIIIEAAKGTSCKDLWGRLASHNLHCCDISRSAFSPSKLFKTCISRWKIRFLLSWRGNSAVHTTLLSICRTECVELSRLLTHFVVMCRHLVKERIDQLKKCQPWSSWLDGDKKWFTLRTRNS
jgi:hypothetical protein